MTRQWSGTAIFEMTDPANFVWLYVSRKYEKPINITLVVYNSGINVKLDLFKFKLDNKSLLIRPKADMGMWDQISIAHIPQDACSLEISLGRNLVMPSQTAIGSKSTWNNVAKGISKLIADGNEDRGAGKCFTINYKADHSLFNIWRSELKATAKINRVVVLSDLNAMCGGLNMWTIIINLLDESGKVLKTFVDKSGQQISSTMSFNINSDQLAKKLEVVMNRTWSQQCTNRSSIDLCEIYAYGEFVCPDGKYGPYCERDCPGCTRELCDPDHGCPHGCQGNWKGNWCDESCVLRYGPNCELLCPDGCAGIGDCNTTTGACLQGCKPGFVTAMCTEPCRPGTFGQNCSKTCDHCAKNETTNIFSCDPEAGECLIGCGEGFGDDHCERIIVQDDALAISTMYALAGFLALALLLLYKSATRPSDDVTITEEGEEQQRVQTEAKEPEHGTLGGLADTLAELQTTQDGPNLVEEPVKTEPKTSNLVAVDKGIMSSNGSHRSHMKLNLMEKPLKTELGSSVFVNIDKVIESSNGSPITQKEPNRIKNPVETELKKWNLETMGKAMNPSTGSQVPKKKQNREDDHVESGLMTSDLVSVQQVYDGKGLLVSTASPKRHNDELKSKAEQSPIELKKESELKTMKTVEKDKSLAKKGNRMGPMLFLKRLSGQKVVITDTPKKSTGPSRLQLKTNPPEKELLKNEGKQPKLATEKVFTFSRKQPNHTPKKDVNQ